MKDQIVKYANDLNKVATGHLSAQEHNLLIEILLELKEKGTEPIVFSARQITEMIPFKNCTLKEVTKHIVGLKDRFFSIRFDAIFPCPDGGVILEYAHLFEIMQIKLNNDRCVESLTLKVNPHYAYMLNDLTKEFTRFEAAEFFSLQSKYSKSLYKMLKQYRTQGWAYFEWSDFRARMGIPDSYQISDIDKQILKPAIKELTWNFGQPDLFTDYHGCDHPAFKKLAYEKIKGGSNHQIVGIKFTFDREKRVGLGTKTVSGKVETAKPVTPPSSAPASNSASATTVTPVPIKDTADAKPMKLWEKDLAFMSYRPYSIENSSAHTYKEMWHYGIRNDEFLEAVGGWDSGLTYEKVQHALEDFAGYGRVGKEVILRARDWLEKFCSYFPQFAPGVEEIMRLRERERPKV